MRKWTWFAAYMHLGPKARRKMAKNAARSLIWLSALVYIPSIEKHVKESQTFLHNKTDVKASLREFFSITFFSEDFNLITFYVAIRFFVHAFQKLLPVTATFCRNGLTLICFIYSKLFVIPVQCFLCQNENPKIPNLKINRKCCFPCCLYSAHAICK